MDKIEKLVIVLLHEEEDNEKVFEKSAWCREHKFEIEAKFLYEQYEVKRRMIQTIKMKVIDETLDV